MTEHNDSLRSDCSEFCWARPVCTSVEDCTLEPPCDQQAITSEPYRIQNFDVAVVCVDDEHNDHREGRAVKPSVTLAEIDEQRAKGWPDFHPEDYCHRCGGRNVSSWSVESDRWNLAFGRGFNDIVCPGCFVAAHEQASGMVCSWKLVPDPTTPFRWAEDVADNAHPTGGSDG